MDQQFLQYLTKNTERQVAGVQTERAGTEATPTTTLADALSWDAARDTLRKASVVYKSAQKLGTKCQRDERHRTSHQSAPIDIGIE